MSRRGAGTFARWVLLCALALGVVTMHHVDLARQIEQAQDPEVQLMTGWLKAWGVALATSGTSMPGMGHGSMPGMTPDDETTQLEQAKDAESDRMWLGMTIEHHQGAIDMANTEQRQGANADARQLAKRIVDAQQAEITTMNGLLGQG